MRLGGDEFMFFVKNSNKAQASVIGPRIARQVRVSWLLQKKDIHVSVSIGMCSTEVTGEYHALYRCAESTLNMSKNMERDRLPAIWIRPMNLECS
ncbi:MAG: diguanylate cyclase domain-containing protein [[Clostridium] scindens]